MSGLSASKNNHGDRGVFSVNWPNLAHQWLPIIDHPYDKVTSEFFVAAPAKYQVAANGLLQECAIQGVGADDTLEAIRIDRILAECRCGGTVRCAPFQNRGWDSAADFGSVSGSGRGHCCV